MISPYALRPSPTPGVIAGLTLLLDACGGDGASAETAAEVEAALPGTWVEEDLSSVPLYSSNAYELNLLSFNEDGSGIGGRCWVAYDGGQPTDQDCYDTWGGTVGYSCATISWEVVVDEEQDAVVLNLSNRENVASGVSFDGNGFPVIVDDAALTITADINVTDWVQYDAQFQRTTTDWSELCSSLDLEPL